MQRSNYSKLIKYRASNSQNISSESLKGKEDSLSNELPEFETEDPVSSKIHEISSLIK